ncbi:MAG: EAL domain-containing protein [Polaromonas sp.]|nr:EAL domain-containing protein [Polaromonas sp.]
MPQTKNPKPKQLNAGAHSLTPKITSQMLELVERASATGIWVFEVPGETLTASDHLMSMFGLRGHGTLALQDIVNFFVPESQSRMVAAIEACKAKATAFDTELEAETTDGQRLRLRAVGEAFFDAAGKVSRIHGALQDLTEAKRAEQLSLSLTMRLSTTLASISEAFVALDRDGRFTYVNGETERLLGLNSADLLGQTICSQLGNAAHGRLPGEIREVLRTGINAEFDEFYAKLGKWLELRVYPFEEGIAVYFRDVTAARQSQEQLLLLQTSISRLNDVVVITDAGPVDASGPRIVFVNDAFGRHTGFSREEVLGKPPLMLVGPLTESSVLHRISLALVQSHPVRAELIIYKKNGEPLWMELEIVAVDYFGRGLTHWVSVARDISERKAAEDEIEHLAFYDTLTQLPNRQLLMTRLEATLLKGARGRQIGALMFIDLDNFKVINDTQGHSKGDLLLQKVGARLSACVRKTDTVARLGGDEFVVMLEDLGDNPKQVVEKAKAIGEQILAALSEPFDLAEYQHYATCSIGITSFSRNLQSIGDLLKQADLAMYQAKAAGRNSVCLFDPEMQAAATANAATSSELRRGLRNRELLLHYQPQVCTETMFGVEALVRWQHPEKGLVYPGKFITQAEESGLILPLGQWVLEEACRQLATWSKSPRSAHLSIAVNVSVRQFRHPQFVDMVMRTISESGISAKELKLELTESLLATDMEVTIAKMGMLRQIGVTLSIDDFGMGYSALSYLKYLPLDQLKIDRAFVKDILFDPNDAAIARTIIGLAQSLGLGVVAEGVETQEQRELLAQFGCECYQGHLFCKALPIDELEIFMKGLAT